MITRRNSQRETTLDTPWWNLPRKGQANISYAIVNKGTAAELWIDSPSDDSYSKHAFYSRRLCRLLSIEEGGFCHPYDRHHKCNNNPVSCHRRMDSRRLVSSIDFMGNILRAAEASEILEECPEVLHTIEIK